MITTSDRRCPILATLLLALAAGASAQQQVPRLALPGAGAASASRETTDAPADTHVGAAVTLEEAREVLASLRRAHAEEDWRGGAELHAGALHRRASAMLQRMFAQRNFLELTHRVAGHEELPDGRMRIDVVAVLRSRLVDEATDRREKSRWDYLFARGEDGVVRVVGSRAGERRLLGAVPSWRPQDWRIRLEIEPRPTVLGTASGLARVSVDVDVRNVGDDPVRVLGFALHPFAGRVDARLSSDGGEATTLALERDEGPGDTHWAELDEPVAPGDVVTLSLDYVIDLIGTTPHSHLGEAGGHLFSESAWHPLFGAPRHDWPQSAPHDLTVVAPAGLSVVAPGNLAALEDLPGDRRSWRWFSRLAGDEIAVVVGALIPTEHETESGVTLETWTPPGVGGGPAGPPTRLVELAEDALSWMSELLGPAPVDRVTFVELPSAAGRVMRAAPAFFAFDDLEIGEPDARPPKSGEPHFFLAHHLAHLWVVESLDARGAGAIALTEGLADHLGVAWIEDEVTRRLPPRWRTDVLRRLVSRADIDRPVASDRDHVPASDTFGRGKAWLALDQYRRFAGDARWRAALAEYWAEARGRRVELPVLLAALAGEDERLRNFVGTWFLSRGLANPRVVGVRLLPGEDGAPGVGEVEIANEGVGPIAFRTRVRVDGEWHEQVVELAAGGLSLLRIPAERQPAAVILDPDRTIWQVSFDDDEWPPERPVTREQLSSPPAIDPEKIEGLIGRPHDLPGPDR